MVSSARTIRSADALLMAHRPAIHQVCRSMVACAARADELTQDTLLVGWVRLDVLLAADSPRQWLLGVARNLCRNDRRKRQAAPTADGFPVLEDPGESALDGLIRRQRERWVQERAAAVLDPMQLRAVELRYREDLSADEIGAALPPRGRTGVRGLLQTCRRRLHNALSERREEFE